jgi:predicted nucleotidyltransferase
MTDFPKLLKALAEGGVEFIIVGGAAATAHGSVRLTLDLDVVYGRSPENIRRLVQALAPAQPYLRGAPKGLPFSWSEETLSNGLNFTLTTRLGAIDLLGEIIGGGGFETLKERSIWLEIFGHRCLCIDLDALIETKLAAGRPRDLETVAELELIRKEKERR